MFTSININLRTNHVFAGRKDVELLSLLFLRAKADALTSELCKYDRYMERVACANTRFARGLKDLHCVASLVTLTNGQGNGCCVPMPQTTQLRFPLTAMVVIAVLF